MKTEFRAFFAECVCGNTWTAVIERTPADVIPIAGLECSKCEQHRGVAIAPRGVWPDEASARAGLAEQDREMGLVEDPAVDALVLQFGGAPVVGRGSYILTDSMKEQLHKTWPAPTIAGPTVIVKRFEAIPADEVRRVLKDAGLVDIDVTVGGHDFEIRTTDMRGIDSGRMRWAVRCATCNVLVHEGSTSAAAQVEAHLFLLGVQR